MGGCVARRPETRLPGPARVDVDFPLPARSAIRPPGRRRLDRAARRAQIPGHP